MKFWQVLIAAIVLPGGVFLLLAWVWRRYGFGRADLVSSTWLKQLRQAERNEFEQVSVRGPFYREGA